MYDMSRFKKRARSVAVGVAASGMVIGNVASVAALNTSSLLLSDPRPSETGVTYTFDSAGFDTGTTINCVSLDFNTAADGTGSVPAGMDTTGATLDGSGTLITEASWTESFGSNGALDLTFAGGETPAASGTLVFTGVDNPNTDDTFFATLTTFENTDCSTDPVDTATVAWATKDGTPVSLTIDPTLTFTCSGVAASQTINGATTTHASTGGSIDYLNDVTASTNGVSAHDLDVTTNAANGFVVYIRHTGQLTNANSDTIDNHTGTNLSPSAFSAAGTESWGYTTDDSTLSAVGDGADRFTDTNEWAGFTTTNEEIMTDESSTTRVGHQVGVAGATEAGTYTTNIVYTVVATF